MSRPGLLEGAVAIVTGGSRGLGRALCRALALEGANVAFTFVRDADGARATLESIEKAGQRGEPHAVSVLERAATERMVAEVEANLGPVGILVNNAAVSQPLPLALVEEEDFDLVMDTNVKGAFFTSKAVLRGMIARRAGVILNIGSIAGVRAIESPVHYAASKAALVGLTGAMAKEMGRHGIRVNCLAPGLLDDGLGREIAGHRLASYLRHTSLRRLGTLDEVARFAAFLVSERSAYLSGETISIDGGI